VKTFQVAKWSVVDDFGKEFYLSFFSTKSRSLAQFCLYFSDYGNWIEFPRLFLSIGDDRLFSITINVGKLTFMTILFGQNWSKYYQ
jgi:hypothetical protein